MKLTIRGDYASSRSEMTGSRKEIRNYVLAKAKEKRRESRIVKRLPDSVHSIDEKLHPSKLVTMASFKLNRMSLENILILLNGHGVYKYSISEL